MTHATTMPPAVYGFVCGHEVFATVSWCNAPPHRACMNVVAVSLCDQQQLHLSHLLAPFLGASLSESLSDSLSLSLSESESLLELLPELLLLLLSSSELLSSSVEVTSSSSSLSDAAQKRDACIPYNKRQQNRHSHQIRAKRPLPKRRSVIALLCCHGAVGSPQHPRQ